MSDFSPVQLDAIEDALEELDAPSGVGVAGDPAVAHRLDEYREILQWTRDAMPLQEVTPGLLDGVLDEARSVTPIAVVASTPAAESTSWWKKLRGVFLIPALAVAGSAALVLLLVRPGAQEESEATLATRAGEPEHAAGEAKRDENAPERQLEEGKPAGVLENGIADASVDQELSRGRLRLEDDASGRGGAAIEGEADVRSQAAPSTPPAAEPPPPPVPSPGPAKKKEKPSDKIFYDEGGTEKASKSGGAPAPGGSSAPVAPPAEQAGKDARTPEPNASVDEPKKDEAQNRADDDSAGAWGTIADADKARRAGNCSAARSKYKALSSAKDSRVRARALAGLGLCETNEKAAEGWFGKARKADPDVAGFIAHERGANNAQADQAESAL